MHSLVRFVFIIVGVIAITGCAIPIRDVDKITKKSDLPPVGEVQTAELGAKLLLQQDVEVVRGRKVAQITRGSMGIFPADFFGMYFRANNGEHYCGTIVFRDPLNNGKQNFICLTDQEFREKNVPYITSVRLKIKQNHLVVG